MNDNTTSETASLVELNDAMDRSSLSVQATVLETIENGGIIFLPQSGFALTDREKEIMLDANITQPTRRERTSRNARPTVVFDPALRKIVKGRIRKPERDELEAMMTRYSEWAKNLLAELLPSYSPNLVRDRITFRPCVRTTTQGLHVDASYGRPSEGRGMLRVFCNVNPRGQPRKWHIGEHFEPYANRFLGSAKVKGTSRVEQLLASLDIVKGKRTAYDHLLANIRRQAKRDESYQADGPRSFFEFPVGSAWFALTDLVLHGALAGQYSLDQTFFVPIDSMAQPEKSSLRILERLTRVRLT